MSEVVFSRRSRWIPRVVREDDTLRLELGAGADALHSPRTFSFPITEAHLDVIRGDLVRHLLLWAALLPLCDAAGIQEPLDEDAAVALLDPILFGPADEIDARFRAASVNTTTLVSYGADTRLLERGQVVDSLHSATEESDTLRLQTYVANRDRARRGVHLGPLDEAVLRYTGQYLHSSTRPGRHPDAVDPALLAAVLEVIATAERASVGLGVLNDEPDGRRRTWRALDEVVTETVRRVHPRLVEDTVRSVSFLVCSEAARRARES